ncbi:hypothetical protein BJ322DRAFT_1003527 [Thelephora terrestris]|uniref:DUF2415 domain-containing protein n=1 Tax=Thelephora terrestris TaxID=56493 RepID=A0A9P6HI22_9AGAM|nr:hypothetical protein BJ322DRAFT_1003527 [Thelephora terrestris]
MTVQRPSLLSPPTPTSSVSTEITIGHVQLRDLLICPHERGVVNYVQGRSILEQNLFRSGSKRAIASLPFTPNTLSSLRLPDSTTTLLAAGGQDAELHLSLHSSSPSSSTSSSPPHHRSSRPHWQYQTQLQGSINNSVMLTSLSLTKANISSVEPRVAVSNNDCSVKFFEVNIRSSDNSPTASRLKDLGVLRIDVPVNHSSVSPDGRTLLSVGDSPQVYLHHISGSSRLSFESIAKYSLVPYTPSVFTHQYYSPQYPQPSLPASFSTSYSANGMKFAVASQEGVAVIWDVRSSKPLKVLETDRTRGKERRATGEASGYMYEEDLWDWSRGGSRAPGWGIRSIKFSPEGADGKEVLVFTEHTSLLHLIDARTFETEQIVRVPDPTISCLQNSGRPGHRSTRSESAISALPTTNSMGLHLMDGPFTSDEELDDGGVVVVPRLGSTREEEDVSRLLRRHGLRTTRTRLRPARRRSESHQDGDGDMEMTDVDEQGDRGDDMEVDELDTECLSSAAGSRAASPTYTPPSHTFSSPSLTTPTLSPGPPYVGRRPRGMRTINPVTTSSMTTLRALANASRARRPETPIEESSKPEDNLDLAGVCFDPTGSHVYVASSKGIVEYRIKGAEKTWWSNTEWA